MNFYQLRINKTVFFVKTVNSTVFLTSVTKSECLVNVGQHPIFIRSDII